MQRPRPKGGASLDRSHEFCRAWSNCKMMRGGCGMGQPGLCFAKGVANGGNNFHEQIFPTLLRGALGLGVFCPATDAPYGFKRVGFSQTFGTCTQ